MDRDHKRKRDHPVCAWPIRSSVEQTRCHLRFHGHNIPDAPRPNGDQDRCDWGRNPGSIAATLTQAFAKSSECSVTTEVTMCCVAGDCESGTGYIFIAKIR